MLFHPLLSHYELSLFFKLSMSWSWKKSETRRYWPYEYRDFWISEWPKYIPLNYESKRTRLDWSTRQAFLNISSTIIAILFIIMSIRFFLTLFLMSTVILFSKTSETFNSFDLDCVSWEQSYSLNLNMTSFVISMKSGWISNMFAFNS